ncbi:hypothetical protein Aduo_015965 [Ancylostoma duodenale]
MYKDFHGKHF